MENVNFEDFEKRAVQKLKATYDKQESFYRGEFSNAQNDKKDFYQSKLNEVIAKREKLKKIAVKYF